MRFLTENFILIFWHEWKIKTKKQSFVSMTGVLQPRKTVGFFIFFICLSSLNSMVPGSFIVLFFIHFAFSDLSSSSYFQWKYKIQS